MDGQNSIVKHYAILIGIDDYPDKPLRGAVRDVQDAKMYIENALMDSVEVQIITASQTDQKPSDSAKVPMCWPTYDNVISAFKMVTSRARAGDFVYIHYSGHGTRKPPSGEFSDQSTGDLALVLLGEEKESQLRYLWGFEMASFLKAMVVKGLVITLVLDCCFSGGVYRREDSTIRFLPYDRRIDSQYPLDPKGLGDSYTVYRDTSMLPNWLINPDRYAILTACGPHEEALEPKFDGQRHGALSYFLLRTLECVGLRKRHKDIYDQLRAKFQSSGLPQNPVFYGNRNQGFFGQVESNITAATVAIIVKRNGTLELQAGYAHGIDSSDQFLLYPLGSAEGDPRSEGHTVAAKVTRTMALMSYLEPLDLPSIRIRTGWMARALTRFALRRIPIRLSSGLPNREEWFTALKERSLDVHVDTSKYQYALEVVLNKDQNFEILDESGHGIINLPSMPRDETDVSQVCSVLEHLARFRLAKDIRTEKLVNSFQQSFEVRIHHKGKFFDSDCLIEMEHNDIAELAVENRGDKVLYVSIYDLGPCWQVENVYRAPYAAVMPKNDEKRPKRPVRKKLRMMVPDRMKEKGYRTCEDIIKVFVCSQPTSFDLLELPRLGGLPKVSKASTTTREGGDASENWAAMNFPVRISLM